MHGDEQHEPLSAPTLLDDAHRSRLRTRDGGARWGYDAGFVYEGCEGKRGRRSG
jgi:hypothetical protein